MVARFGARDVQRLLKDAGIVRHRGKIESTINNARRALELDRGARLAGGVLLVVGAAGGRAAQAPDPRPADEDEHDAAIGGVVEGPEEAGLDVRRPHHLLRLHAGDGPRQRSRRRVRRARWRSNNSAPGLSVPLSWGQAAKFSESLSRGRPSASQPVALPAQQVSKTASSAARDRRRNFVALCRCWAICVDFRTFAVGLRFVSPRGMARRHRIVFCGAIYHVMARGNRKQPIFVDDVDRTRFLTILAIALVKFGAECFAYCLMGNHFHMVLHTPRANIADVMHHIDSLYAQYVNWRHHTTGHLWDGPYKGIVIDDTDYLLSAIAYVLRNPVAAGLVTDAGHWQWSSYNATIGKASPRFLTLTWLESLFGASTLEESRELLIEHVRKEPEEYSDLVRAAAEGPHEFKKRVRKVIGATLYRARLPRSYRALGRPPLSDLFADCRRAERRAAILRAHVVHGYLLIEIANYLELHPTTISRIVNETGSYRLPRQ